MRIDSERISRALRVLAGVRNHLKGEELKGIDHIGTETYCNGREQGICIIAYPSDRINNPDPLRVMFSEHRIASDAIVVYDELGLGSNGNIPAEPTNINGLDLHRRFFEKEGSKGNEVAAARAIAGIIRSFSLDCHHKTRQFVYSKMEKREGAKA